MHTTVRTFIATAALALAPLVAVAQQEIGTYIAEIGQQDLFNSEGQRLTAPWQVLRQDRANYHRFGIAQPGDQWDPWFDNADNRATMERLVMNGFISPQASRDIMAGGATVVVTIFGSGGMATAVNVDVYR